MSFILRRHPLLWLLGAGLALVGCEGPSLAGGSSAPEEVGSAVPTFEQFEARTYREPDTGLYIVDGDTPVRGREALRQFYETYVKPGQLIVHTSGGVDAKWSDTQKLSLTYCVSTAFGNNYGAVVQAMSEAAFGWTLSANVQLIHQSQYDSTCGASTPVVFDVRPVSGANYLARAFFPNFPRSDRNILIDGSSFGNIAPFTLTGVLRHEVGHVLGFRHEHTRPESGTCFEDSNWRALTPYDSASVMHYPQCQGTNTGDLVLTQTDRDGAVTLYGPALFSAPIQSYTSGWDFGNPTPYGTLTGDFNGDGRTDYARLGGTSSYFFFSNGNGTFTTYTQGYPTGSNFGWDASWPPIAADFNGDGRTDYGRLGGTYSLFYFSNGDGTFNASTQTYPTGWDFQNPSAWKDITGDFNADGKDDYGRLGATYALFFFGNGNGTFTTYTQNYPTGWNFGWNAGWAPITGDFNGDGRTDYARLGGTYDHPFLSNGDGTFTVATNNHPTIDFGNPSAWKAITGDFNGDGRTDFMRLGSTYSTIFYSNYDGTFGTGTQLHPYGRNYGLDSTWPAIAGDFNGDGKGDYGRLGGTSAHFFLRY